MSENKRIILIILGIGLGVGVLFSYLTRGTTYVMSTFVALATVQGAFVGIVFSIFILASQVNATEFSPLTLEQLSKSNTFLGLLSFYALSILFDIYVIQTQGIGFSIPGYIAPHIPNSWNYTVGVAAGLASISLFSLILARNLLVSLTSPETLLEESSKRVTNNGILVRPESQSGDTELKPERTPLLTIERILSSTAERDDEYTVQLSIYYMYESIKKLLESSKKHSINQTSIRKSTLNFEIIAARWETCIEYGISGPLDRRIHTFRIQSELIGSFIEYGQKEIAEKEMEVLTEVYHHILKTNHFEADLLIEYENLAEKAIKTSSTGILTKIESELINISQLPFTFGINLESSQREIISKSLSLNLGILSQAISSDSINSDDSRILANEVLKQTNQSLTKILGNIEIQGNSKGIRQNILNEIYRAIIEASCKTVKYDQIVFQRLILGLSEIAIELGKEVSDVGPTLCNSCEDVDLLEDSVRDLEEKTSSKSIELREFTVFSLSDPEIQEFIKNLCQEIQSKN